MKRVLLSTMLVVAAVALLSARGAAIKGTYIEARTAEVFAGACIMNGEAGTTGREALLASAYPELVRELQTLGVTDIGDVIPSVRSIDKI